MHHARKVMPEGVQGIFRLALLVHNAGGLHDGREVAQHILVVVDQPRAKWQTPGRHRPGSELPLLQRGECLRGEAAMVRTLESDFGGPISL